MSALVIGPDQLAALARIKAYAEEHCFTLAEVEKAAAERTCLTEDRAFECMLPIGHRVVFSIEQHPVGWCRHLSMSVHRAGYRRPPSIEATVEVGELLGMRMDTTGQGSRFYFEPIDEEPPQAISIVEPMEPKAEGETPP